MADIGRAALILTANPGPMVRQVRQGVRQVNTQLRGAGGNVQPTGIRRFVNRVNAFMRTGIGQGIRGAMTGAFAGLAAGGGLTGIIGGALGGLALVGGPVGIAAAAAGALTLAVGRAVGALKNMVTGEAKVIDQTAKLARRLDVGIHFMEGLQHVAALNGIEMSQVNTAMARLNQRIGRGLAMGAGSALPALRALGIQLEDLRGMSSEQRFHAVADAFRNIGDRAEQAGIASQLFGRAGRDMVIMLDQFNTIETEARRRGQLGFLNESQARIVEGMVDAFTNLKAVWQGMRQQATLLFAPLATAWADFTRSFWTNFQPILQQLFRFGRAVLGFLATGFRRWSLAFEALAPALREIGSLIQEMGSAFMEVFGNDFDATVEDMIRNNGARMAQQVVQWIHDNREALLDFARRAARAARYMANFFFVNFRLILAGIQPIANAMALMIRAAIAPLRPALSLMARIDPVARVALAHLDGAEAAANGFANGIRNAQTNLASLQRGLNRAPRAITTGGGGGGANGDGNQIRQQVEQLVGLLGNRSGGGQGLRLSQGLGFGSAAALSAINAASSASSARRGDSLADIHARLTESLREQRQQREAQQRTARFVEQLVRQGLVSAPANL